MDDDDLTAEIKAQVEEWSTNSNDCFHIRLQQGTKVEGFQPQFTYPFFGEEEAIFGYRDLSIDLTFASHNLEPKLNIKYGKIFKAQGEVQPTDIREALSEYLPKMAFNSAPVTESGASEWLPPGQKIREYRRNGQKYEIWCTSLADRKAKKILENMQILVPMFIEGGTKLELEQHWTAQRWKLFLLYRVSDVLGDWPSNKPAYCLAGYGTSYRVFTFPDRNSSLSTELDLFAPAGRSLEQYISEPDASAPNQSTPTSRPGDLQGPLDLPSRERLSQFLILPPFQGAGHGQALYTAMFSHLTSPPNVREFTVEDPNEAFDDLRDLCDLKYLRKHSDAFDNLRINVKIPPDKLASSDVIPTDLIVPLETRVTVMKEFKIMQRQFDRLVEMHTLSFIPPLHRSRNRVTRRDKSSNDKDKAFYFWRLYAKQRLFVFNRDALDQLEGEERKDRLESAVDGVMEGYVAILERLEDQSDVHNGADDENVARAPLKRKRKVIADADEEEEDDEGADGNMKRSKKLA